MKNIKIILGVAAAFMLFAQAAAFSQNSKAVEDFKQHLKDLETKITAYEKAVKTETRAARLDKMEQDAVMSYDTIDVDPATEEEEEKVYALGKRLFAAQDLHRKRTASGAIK